MSANSNPTQAQRVLAYIEEHGSITQFEAFTELGIMRLASRIADLRRMGFPINSETKKVKNRFDETCRVKNYSLGETHLGWKPIKKNGGD